MLTYKNLASEKILSKIKGPVSWALLPAPAGAKEQSVFLPYKLGLIHKPLAETFKLLDIKRAIHIGLPFWQMEKVYHNTCRALKIPDCMGTIYNPALFFELVKTLKAEAIAIVPQILPLLLSKKNKAPEMKEHLRLWYFIDGYLDPELATAIKEWTPEALIWQSFGPFPPVPAASQCVNLARAGRLNCFHHRSGHKVEIKNGKIAISSRENPAFPLIGYRTGVSGILKKESCPCGADKLLQIHD